jgi:beta-galactosidase
MTTRRHFLISAAGAGVAASGVLPLTALAADARFKVADGQFQLDGKPFQILAGEMHYPRIARASWRDRMRKLKSLGLNTLTTYVFWNAHETAPGQYDFSDNLDVAAYIRMAQEEGLWVNLRPGPYVCAEWDGGGFPAWVMNDADIRPRSLDPRFMTPVKTWLKRLAQELKPVMISRGGPVILTQIENEYGSYGNDHAYMEGMHQALLDAGFDGVFYTADGAAVMGGGQLPGLVAGINFGTTDKAEKEFATRATFRSEGPYMCSELWGGWFDHFGEMHASMEIPPLISSLKWMMDRHYSISFYVVHGGTSFGFMAGANRPKDGPYQPDISSYDYDALIDEAGRPTPKYDAVKALFANYLPPEAFAPMPAAEPGIDIPRFRLTETAPLSQLLGAPVAAPTPQTLEALHQDHGMVLYRHHVKTAFKGRVSVDEVRDYARIFVDGVPAGTLDRRLGDTGLTLDLPHGAVLDILVDTMGHINYGPYIGKDQKGLIGAVMAGGRPLNDWAQYRLPLDDLKTLRFSAAPARGPAFYRGAFELKTTGFTFLDVRGWGKGYVWINGHNLGRFWDVGPQRALFVPGSWLKAGANEVIVLDLNADGDRSLAGDKSQIWDRPGLVAG